MNQASYHKLSLSIYCTLCYMRLQLPFHSLSPTNTPEPHNHASATSSTNSSLGIYLELWSKSIHRPECCCISRWFPRRCICKWTCYVSIGRGLMPHPICRRVDLTVRSPLALQHESTIRALPCHTTLYSPISSNVSNQLVLEHNHGETRLVRLPLTCVKEPTMYYTIMDSIQPLCQEEFVLTTVCEWCSWIDSYQTFQTYS